MLPFFEHSAVAMISGERDAGSARRRRERRLRSWLRHERMTVAAELSAARHHSRDGGQVSHVGLRAQKTDSSWGGRRPGVLEDPGPPQLGVERAACPRSTGLPPLPDRCSGDVHDATLVKFLLRQTLLQRKKGRGEEEGVGAGDEGGEGVRGVARAAGQRLAQFWLVMLVTMHFGCVPLGCRRPRSAASWSVWTRRTVMPRLVICPGWLCWLRCASAVFLLVVAGQDLGRYDQKDSCSDMDKGVMMLAMHLALCPLWFAGPC